LNKVAEVSAVFKAIYLLALQGAANMTAKASTSDSLITAPKLMRKHLQATELGFKT
jgi:hypothetical protein